MAGPAADQAAVLCLFIAEEPPLLDKGAMVAAMEQPQIHILLVVEAVQVLSALLVLALSVALVALARLPQ
jgi:hypothetical protein